MSSANVASDKSTSLSNEKKASQTYKEENKVSTKSPLKDKSSSPSKSKAKTTMKNYTEILNLLKEYNLKFLSHWARTYNFQKWKVEHHPKCAYLDSGVVTPGTVEFYKEIVSLLSLTH